ncbi:MAG: hypothetical protein FD180_3688 [Planctomycetota bacterium]|nr:MAG: hypothetical protein FD180_3688 [Planctomycetota bacterium]
MPSMRFSVSLLALIVAAGCGKKAPPPSESKAVLDSYEAALFLPEPDMNVLLVHAAWLGPDAIPPILRIWPSTSLNEKKRILLTRFLEILAWNGFRTMESVKLLAGMNRERQPQVRKNAVGALFASGVDLGKLDHYWDPGDAGPGHTSNPNKSLRLPFQNCRELLARQGVAVVKGPDGAVAGDPGRTHVAQPPITQAFGVIHKWWTVESEPALRIFAAINAIRTGDINAAEPLIEILRPVDDPKKNAALENVRSCALRALQESSGQQLTSWAQWDAWWQKNRPPPPTPKRPPEGQPPPLKPR